MAHPELDRFAQLYRLADKLIAEASKDDVAEAARILALDLAQYKAMYGVLPADSYVSLAAVDSLTPELAKTLADGMENLVGARSHARPVSAFPLAIDPHQGGNCLGGLCWWGRR